MFGQKKKQDLLPNAPPQQRTRLETLALPKARRAVEHSMILAEQGIERDNKPKHQFKNQNQSVKQKH